MLSSGCLPKCNESWFQRNLSLEHIPGLASILVEVGIDSISFFPDALFKGIENTVTSEKTKNENIG